MQVRKISEEEENLRMLNIQEELEAQGKNLIVDPPSGWGYGFPKPYINKEKLPFNDWLLANGYPQKEIDQWPDGVPCRYWEDNTP